MCSNLFIRTHFLIFLQMFEITYFKFIYFQFQYFSISIPIKNNKICMVVQSFPRNPSRTQMRRDRDQNNLVNTPMMMMMLLISWSFCSLALTTRIGVSLSHSGMHLTNTLDKFTNTFARGIVYKRIHSDLIQMNRIRF